MGGEGSSELPLGRRSNQRAIQSLTGRIAAPS
jgi:hypothetical protein